MTLNTDDPKLTAYALGELPPAEVAEVEMLLADMPEARAAVEEIRATAQLLGSELAAESSPGLTMAQQMAVKRRLAPAKAPERENRFLARLLLYGGATVVCVMMAGMLLPALSKAKSKAQRMSAVSRLQRMEIGAKLAAQDASYFRLPTAPFNTESYNHIQDNPFLAVAQNPLSTFSIDVDTASYANVRRFLNQGQRPPPDAVRIEELVNYFTYDYPQPKGEHPFSVNVEIAGCPWNAEHRLARIGLKGREVPPAQRPECNLVFLIDVSGSMSDANKLPLVKKALHLLVEQLNERDTVSIIVYAGASGEVLPVTPGTEKRTIFRAIDRLESGGSTHGSAGIQLAYATAIRHYIKGGANRVILCTDGDFNVGVTSAGDLVRLIREKAQSSVFLSVFGFGMGNLKDGTLEQLADKGNGSYGYVDSLDEARKVFVEQLSGTLVTIAKDVKIQVEFNPAHAAAYRLIGYENRLLRKEDFNDDTKDAGEIGAGHTVTALYEIVPPGKEVKLPGVDSLKYQSSPAAAPADASSELLTVKLRYKLPEGETSQLIEVPVTDGGRRCAQASADFKFASAVAGFGMILRGSEHRGTATLDAVQELAEEGKGRDANGYRAEFLQLIRQAKAAGVK